MDVKRRGGGRRSGERPAHHEEFADALSRCSRRVITDPGARARFLSPAPCKGRATAGRSLQQRHKGCAPSSAGASSVAARSIPRAKPETGRRHPWRRSQHRKIADGLLLRVPPNSQWGTRVSRVRRIRSRHCPARPAPSRHGRLYRNDQAGLERGGDARSGVLPRHSTLRCRTDRQRRIRRRGGCFGRWFDQRPRRHCLHRTGPGGSTSAAGTLEEEQASGRGRNGRCPCRWRPDRCRAAVHQAFQQPHTRSLTAGAGDRGYTPDSDHRLGIGATGHPGFAATRPSPTHDNEPTAERHRCRASHGDDEPAAQGRRHGPVSRDPERNAAHHTRVGRRDARRQRRHPGPGPGPGDDRARFRRTPWRRAIGCEPSADHVVG